MQVRPRSSHDPLCRNGSALFLDLRSRPKLVAVEVHWINETELINKSQCRKQFRRSILEAWNWKCAYCGDSVRDGATLDHVVAQINGGLTVRENLVACCQRCNGKKGSKNVWDWYRRQPFFCIHREAAIWRWHFMNDVSVFEAHIREGVSSDHALESRA